MFTVLGAALILTGNPLESKPGGRFPRARQLDAVFGRRRFQSDAAQIVI